MTLRPIRVQLTLSESSGSIRVTRCSCCRLGPTMTVLVWSSQPSCAITVVTASLTAI